MSNGKLFEIHDREIHDRRRSIVFFLALLTAMIVLTSSLVIVLG